MSFASILDALRGERERIEAAISALESGSTNRGPARRVSIAEQLHQPAATQPRQQSSDSLSSCR